MTTPAQSTRIRTVIDRASAQPDIRAEVEANHDDNRWWPLSVADPRIRMLAAGWSTRISYRMIGTYREVIRAADTRGFDVLAQSVDANLTDIVAPLGLTKARIGYLRSLADFITRLDKDGVDPASTAVDADTFIHRFATEVDHASYKIAQCATLYARGYHCGIIPVDSGMVTRLAPLLGINLPAGPLAHERLRQHLQYSVSSASGAYRDLITKHQHTVTVPTEAAPTWWAHLVLIYFKRLYLNQPHERLCRRSPVCPRVLDCPHALRSEAELQ